MVAEQFGDIKLSSATLCTFYAKTQLLFQCQPKVVLHQMDHPVFI